MQNAEISWFLVPSMGQAVKILYPIIQQYHCFINTPLPGKFYKLSNTPHDK